MIISWHPVVDKERSLCNTVTLLTVHVLMTYLW